MNLETQPNLTDATQENIFGADKCGCLDGQYQSLRIAVIPRQSTQSCEMVIVALANQLAEVYSALSMAMETHIYDEHDDREQFFDDPYYEAYFGARKMLNDLARDWPHLDLP